MCLTTQGRHDRPHTCATGSFAQKVAGALERFNNDAAFGEEFLSRPGWGVVTATTPHHSACDYGDSGVTGFW